MKISIVTVCYNSADTIADTLRSVACQTYKNVEHIIIDGGSTDETLDIIRREGAHVATLISERDEGVYHAMNKGWRKATGDVIAFLNSDDVYMDDSVLQQVASVMEQPECDACYADLLYVCRDNTRQVVRYWQGQEYRPGNCLKGWMPAHPTLFAKKHVFEKAGGFNTHYQRQSDFELMLRWFEIHHIRSVYIPKTWIRMRMGGISNNSLLGIIKGNIEAYHACRALGFNVTPLFMLRKVMMRLPQYWHRPAIPC